MSTKLRTGMTRSPLASALSRCAEICEETLDAYLDRERPSADKGFMSSLLLACGALETATRSVDEGSPTREVSLLVAGKVCREAADAIRARGLDERLLRSAAACERAVHLCATALASPRR